LIQNQVLVNKSFAMAMKSMMDLAFPKVIYDTNRIQAWNNAVGGAIGVRGDIDGAAKVLEVGRPDPNVSALIDQAITLTRDLAGVTDVTAGGRMTDNASVLEQMRRSARMATENVAFAYGNLIRQAAEVFLKFVCAKYGGFRRVGVLGEDGKTMALPFAGMEAEAFRAEIVTPSVTT